MFQVLVLHLARVLDEDLAVDRAFAGVPTDAVEIIVEVTIVLAQVLIRVTALTKEGVIVFVLVLILANFINCKQFTYLMK